mgnify:CR=1 FL=1
MSDYNASLVDYLFYDFGPKWFLQTDAEGNIFVPVNYNVVPPMMLWYNGLEHYLCSGNYEKGIAFLERGSESSSKEYDFNKEYSTTIDGWSFELHGSLRCGLSAALNRGVDAIQEDICDKRNFRFWDNDGKKIPLPEENDDVLLIFTHFIKHFYKGELGIRQICDWCRLLWYYRESIDRSLLEKRLKQMGIQAQWNGFGAFSVDYLGMPKEAMPRSSAVVASRWAKVVAGAGSVRSSAGT